MFAHVGFFIPEMK